MKKFLGLMAVAAAIAIAALVQRAEALSLITPASVGSAKHASENLIVEVRRGGGGFRGGGFRGGGFRAAGFHGGFHRGGFHRGGFHGGRHFHRHHFHRHHFHHRRHFHRPRFYVGGSVYYPRRCRIVWTDFGPRKICRRPIYPYYYY